ncbi:hypothetical protein ACLOJK_001135 [Asimina triloba]
MAGSKSLLLQEKIPRKNTLQRLSDLIILLLLMWRLAFVCELWFTFLWVLAINSKWNLVVYKTHPQSLMRRFNELPAVDMFVTTADCTLEPPIITANTVLSLLAVDYPPDKLSCYVSDDGCSPITYYSLREACKFAQMWVPFSKKYDIQARAPADFFWTVPPRISNQDPPSPFLDEWRQMKEEYKELGRRIEAAVQHSVPRHVDDEFTDFLNIERSNHPSIVKVICENKEGAVPRLVYVSREKRPSELHNFKAGALNALAGYRGPLLSAHIPIRWIAESWPHASLIGEAFRSG